MCREKALFHLCIIHNAVDKLPHEVLGPSKAVSLYLAQEGPTYSISTSFGTSPSDSESESSQSTSTSATLVFFFFLSFVAVVEDFLFVVTVFFAVDAFCLDFPPV